MALRVTLLAFIAAGLWNLGAVPRLWWDEGWTLSVARNLAERGHYGRILDGQLAPPGLEAAFPTTGLAALSFKLLGVGAWQGRLPSLLCMAGAIALLLWLAQQLFGRRVAVATLVVLLLMPWHADLHPLIIGRQVLAEPIMMLALLGGYACLLQALRQETGDRRHGDSRQSILNSQFSILWLLGSIGCWGVGLNTKAQTLPFWLCSVLVALVIALILRQRALALTIGASILGSLVAKWLIGYAWTAAIAGHTLPAEPISGIYSLTALTLNATPRTQAALVTLVFGLPTLVALIYATVALTRRVAPPQNEVGVTRSQELAIEAGLLALAGSWFAWYLLLSVSWPRYLFPAIFIGSIFVAKALSDATNDFDIPGVLGRIATAFRPGAATARARLSGLALLLLTCYLVTNVVLVLLMLTQLYQKPDTSAVAAATFLNEQLPSGARIETYDAELMLFLNRPYHYPPDQTHIDLGRRDSLKEDVAITYDPLAFDPKYLVVGPQLRTWKLYDALIAQGAFRLLRTIGQYDIYERVDEHNAALHRTPIHQTPDHSDPVVRHTHNRTARRAVEPGRPANVVG